MVEDVVEGVLAFIERPCLVEDVLSLADMILKKSFLLFALVLHVQVLLVGVLSNEVGYKMLYNTCTYLDSLSGSAYLSSSRDRPLLFASSDPTVNLTGCC